MIGAILTVVTIFFLSMFVTVAIFYVSLKKKKTAFEENAQTVQQDFAQKLGIYADLNDLALGLIDKTELDKVDKELSELEEKLRAEKGRVTITQAELDAIETRLRELEEFERELEASMVQGTKEIEMLKRQEDDVKKRNEEFSKQLNDTVAQIEKVGATFSQEDKETLDTLKSFLNDLIDRLDGEASGVERINKEYLDLKKSYDALDIEYAQLYEKHNATKAPVESS